MKEKCFRVYGAVFHTCLLRVCIAVSTLYAFLHVLLCLFLGDRFSVSYFASITGSCAVSGGSPCYAGRLVAVAAAARFC